MSNLSYLLKSPVVWDWELHDDDSCQYMRKTGPRTYEMIQCVWLDTTEEDTAKGLYEYVVVTGEVNLNDLSDEGIQIAIAPYGYSLSDFETWEGDVAESMIAECYLEDELMDDVYMIAGFNAFDETKTFVGDYVVEHKLPR